LQTSAEQLAKAAEPAKIIACIMIVASIAIGWQRMWIEDAARHFRWHQFDRRYLG